MFAILTLRSEFGYSAFKWVGDIVQTLVNFSDAGAEFAFSENFKVMGLGFVVSRPCPCRVPRQLFTLPLLYSCGNCSPCLCFFPMAIVRLVLVVFLLSLFTLFTLLLSCSCGKCSSCRCLVPMFDCSHCPRIILVAVFHRVLFLSLCQLSLCACLVLAAIVHFSLVLLAGQLFNLRLSYSPCACLVPNQLFNMSLSCF